MIIKASKRGGSKDLAAHLMSDENDHVDVLALKGAMSDNLPDALQEMYATSRATKCRKFMLSISFNPPPDAQVDEALIKQTMNRSLAQLKLSAQPYVLVAHEKEGRRHYHAVVSLIDTQDIKAIKLPYFKTKLNALAKDLYLENGWELPKGFENPRLKDPSNFTLAEWQQAKRHQLDPKEIKAQIGQAWQISDNQTSLNHALNEVGYFLARGDRRGFVVMNWQGEIYALSRMAGVKTRELRARLGEADKLPTVEDIKALIANKSEKLHQRLSADLKAQHQKERQPFLHEKQAVVQRQRQERTALKSHHQKRTHQENQARQAKIRHGWRGLWDFFTGKSRKQHAQNKLDAAANLVRDQKEKEALITQQLQELQKMAAHYKALKARHAGGKTGAAS